MFFNNINKFKILLAITFAWAYISVLFSNMFMKMLKCMMYIPDKYISIFLLKNEPYNSNGKRVNILDVRSDKEILTNKLKLFVQCYWKRGGGESAFDNNGFNIREFGKMVGASVFYCTYLLSDKSHKMTPEEFLNSINQVIFTSDDGTYYKKINKNGNTDVLLGHVDLDG